MESNPFMRFNTTADAVIGLMATYYVFHFKYSEKVQNALLFLQSYVFGEKDKARGDFRHHSLPCRMIVGSWLFAILVFNNAFTGSLISMITNQKFQYVIQSIEDVATDEDVQPLIINESSTHSEFKVLIINESTEPIFRKILKRLEANPDKLLVSSSSNLVELLLSDPRQVLILSDLLADSEIEKDFRKTGKCRVTVLPNKIKSRKNSIFLQKNSPFTKTINKQ
ncbi:hypothetical protein OUZ56_015841 [Daphnia magna]|uniref:Ionotropic glutamate receptor C-terminal domain-containing protein n=1 Tax=Daphnia magna TaxID=35525 RepID=A0ABR0AP42_9CRUS|nr:hypothetical protein OUZ56_015841 [Daphnia magna]